MLTVQEITRALHAIGLAEGMSVVVHSSLSSLGLVEGGADAVIDALLDAIGEAGTLVLPTFTFPPDPVFDPRTTRSSTGLIPETFRKRAGVRRSLHPTHSVAACGLLAEHFISGHPGATALGMDSPLHRLALAEGCVLLLGVQHTSNAMVHVGEAIARVPYLDLPYSDAFSVSIPVRLPAGGEVIVPPKENPGCSVNFNVVEEPLKRRGAITYGKVGDADSQLMRATDIIDVVGELVSINPAALLCDIEWCPFCPRARKLVEL
ncbi:MAG: aminoglycoside N(3)-acetyltransferase [Candidatus Abyssobacteria bacterium SURF_17]|jgi:aminoglycoside 3-N-acetyltransferase|uniref:Aminoglycoside N(3)-acetyltransferase n=1 Tax=Candidatus Abyssobacteria bacterium SURF_17 TaxID=2093361 RepID=A0A419EXF5_9BACT|nr:MAG: aminoglycoside N(3)-acetyltransferase [Candidatus Abyssubacteria bacterium SURF_17]